MSNVTGPFNLHASHAVAMTNNPLSPGSTPIDSMFNQVSELTSNDTVAEAKTSFDLSGPGGMC